LEERIEMLRPIFPWLLAAACTGFAACSAQTIRLDMTSSGGRGGSTATATSNTSGGGATFTATSSTGSIGPTSSTGPTSPTGSATSTSTTGTGGSGGAAGGAIDLGDHDAGIFACGLRLSSECSENPTGPVIPHTTEEFAAAVAGRWLVCSDHESVFGRDLGDVGIEITPDNHWYKLYPAQGGGVLRGAGFDEEGTWQSIGVSPTNDHPQLNLNIFGGLMIFSLPALASTPRAIRLDNEVFKATYVTDDGIPTGDARCIGPTSSTGPTGPTGSEPSTSTTGTGGNGGAAGGQASGDHDAGIFACGLRLSSECSENPTGPVIPHTTEEFAAAVTGRWLLCSDHESVFGRDLGDVGIEITPDNHWYKLYPAQGSGVLRGAGFDEEGTWQSTGVSATNDHPQLNLNIFGGGMIFTLPDLASTPRAIRLNNEGVLEATYVIDDGIPTGDARCQR
jgi:hypothetical protein